MRCFVTGGTGSVGEGLTRQLVLGGHEVVGLTRGASGKALLEAAGAEAIIGDMCDDSNWKDAARSADAIIHAGQISIGRLNKRAHRRLVNSDRRALELLLAAAGDDLKAFIYTSGYLVYGPCPDGPKSEDDEAKPYAPIEFKLDHEKVALASGKPVVVLRPSTVYGARGLFAKFSLKPTMAGGPARTLGDGLNTVGYVHTDDLGQAYRLVIENVTPGQIYNVTDDEPTTPRAMLEELARHAGAKSPRSLPAWIARLALAKFATPLLSTTQATSDKIKSALGWKPIYPTIREGAAALVAAAQGRGEREHWLASRASP